MTPRRELQLAVLLCLTGSLLAYWAAGRGWAEITTTGGLTIGSRTAAVDASRNAGWVRALAYVGFAGVLAVAATRRAGRVAVGAVAALAGAALVVGMARFLPDFTRNAGKCPSGADCDAYEVVAGHPVWGWLTLCGGLLLLAGGVLVAVRGRRWAALGSSYQVPAARTAEPPVTDKAVWDALDEGHDPTA